jgi:hypothetical protein
VAQRLGHTSIKTTEMYCAYLTPEEHRVAKGVTPVQKTKATPALKVVDSV